MKGYKEKVAYCSKQGRHNKKKNVKRGKQLQQLNMKEEKKCVIAPHKSELN